MTETTITTERIVDALKEVIDPEVGLNIVDLGLIYEVGLDESELIVDMTLTTPGCPLHATIEAAVKRSLFTNIPEINEVTVRLVWNPPWSEDLITDEGKRQLGW